MVPGDVPPHPELVNSWNEWDKLEEVVVGVADMACFEPIEPGVRPQVRGLSGSPQPSFPKGAKPKSAIDAANAELDGLVSVLEREGIVVCRPSPFDFDQPLRTSEFEVPNQYCAACPRDVMITIGREVIEATMSRRARFFEYMAYRELVYRYWNNDASMVWTVAPKPSMRDSMYRQEFWDLPMAARHRNMHNFEFCITQDEVVFDAADISRFGRDIFIQESMTSNRRGIEWLRRHLEPQGLRVHAVHFPLDYFPSHIDCTFVPLRPGLILTNPERPLREGEEALFVKNGWEFIPAPHPGYTNDDMPAFCQSSMWLAMNVLSLSPSKVVVEEREMALKQLLEKLDFEVIPVPFRNVYEFGGSLHCATWDIRRAGNCEDYFDACG
jgi:glycine amidinotransferase